RSLAAGLPEELAWPALESVYSEFAADAARADSVDGSADGVGAAALPGVAGVTSTWPVLTVFGRDRAVAVAPDGARGSCAFTVPEAATMFAVHYVGGSFLVSWALKENPYYCDTAVWADRPEEPFTPDEVGGLVPFGGKLDGAYGFQFETADGGGRHGGLRALRPGGTGGIDRYELQVGDGSRIWTNGVYEKSPWRAVDAVSGEPRDGTDRPEFPGDDQAAAPSQEGMALAPGALHLAPLPAGLTDSPLGSRDGLVGTRVLFRTRHRDPAPDHYLVESIDGRSARFDIDRQGQRPWGLWAPPESTAGDTPEGRAAGTPEGTGPGGGAVDVPGRPAELVVLAEAETPTGVRAYTSDGVLLWELDGHHSPAHPRVRPARRVTASGGVALPPAFWYLLRTRDADGSRALRTVGRQTADNLLAAARDGSEALRTAVARELPQITEPVLVD
ncbi:hypothetical protein R6L23_36560, partial [Streptomyces sp. SR27]|nr:hypothetical protein [Streptomyces sp. SR27]